MHVNFTAVLDRLETPHVRITNSNKPGENYARNYLVELRGSDGEYAPLTNVKKVEFVAEARNTPELSITISS